MAWVLLAGLAASGCGRVGFVEYDARPIDGSALDVDAASGPTVDANPSCVSCQSCGAGDCCEDQCQGCTYNCPDDCSCSVWCSRTDTCILTCGVSASCTFDCVDTLECYPRCASGPGSSCVTDCTGNRLECLGECRNGTACLLNCAQATGACRFEICSGGSGLTDCGDGWLACNRACP